MDVIVFQQLVAESTPEALAQAATLHGGEFLSGLTVPAAPFEEWLRSERERLHELAVEALARLLAWQRDAGDESDALQTVQPRGAGTGARRRLLESVAWLL